jgi:tRNA 2-thiouridine synthesizing protein C
MNARRILFVIAHPPRRGALALETLDELLVGAAFEQKVSVLFVGDGVYQLLDNQAALDNGSRGYRALPTYEVEDVYVEKRAMQQRGLLLDALALPARVLSRRAIQSLIAAQDVVVPD